MLTKIGIHWNGFLEIARKEYPKEACAFLFSKQPYSLEEEWFVFPVKNISDRPEKSWIPERRDMIKAKNKAIKLGLTHIGNIHTHPYNNKGDIDYQFLPSGLDLKFARRFNNIIRGILVVDKTVIYGIKFHDKFGENIHITVEEVTDDK